MNKYFVWLVIVIVVIVLFAMVVLNKKKTVHVASIEYYRGGSETVSSYQISLTESELYVCDTDELNNVREFNRAVNEQLLEQIDKILNLYQVEKMVNLKPSSVIGLDEKTESLTVKLTDGTTVLLNNKLELDDNSKNLIAQFLQIIDSYLGETD
ncbi:MAG: hypothetical protein ACI4WG_02740 [Erysipelotrichaceae bacterium]